MSTTEQNTNVVPKINKYEFIEDVNAGMFKADLATKYSIAESSVTEIVKKLGLTLKRYVAPKYVLVDEEPTTRNPLSLDNNNSMN